jgi:bifunctional non-homologous end joining protein LigD
MREAASANPSSMAPEQQMTLSLGDGPVTDMALPHLGWPVAADGGAPFDDEGRFFEPWWPGAHALLRLDGARLELRTEHLADPLAAFPELHRLASDIVADKAVVEGTLLALDEEGRPDARLLRAALTAGGTPSASGAFVATDLPWLAGEDLRRTAYTERRRRLIEVMRDSDNAVVSRGLIGEGVTLGHAVASMGLHAISARRLDGPWRTGRSSDAWLRLPLNEPAADRPRPFLVLLERLPFEA